MKYIIAAAFLLFTTSAFAMPAAHNYTPLPKAKLAGCVAVQRCRTCYRQDVVDKSRLVTYQCDCHMECLPGIH